MQEDNQMKDRLIALVNQVIDLLKNFSSIEGIGQLIDLLKGILNFADKPAEAE